MKAGGVGGGNTVTGLRFEKKTDLGSLLSGIKGYSIIENQLHLDNKPIGFVCPQGKFYSVLLRRLGIEWESCWSKRLMPDEALYLTGQKHLYVIEKKFQQCEGSVDEKLQTGDFKKRQYSKLMRSANATVDVIFVLSQWFSRPKYRDSLEYLESSGCSYYFEEIPLSAVGLSEP